MKVALSGMILGASMFGANAATFPFGGGKILTFENNAVSQTAGAAITCSKVYAEGDADRSYLDFNPAEGSFNKPAGIEEFEAGSTLAYECGIGANTVLIVFVGEDPNTDGDCVTGTISVSIDTEPTEAGRHYSPQITSTITYGCRKKHAFQASDVSAAIELSLKNELSTLFSPDLGADTVSLDRQTYGKVWSKQWNPSYDLGLDEPIQFYYESPGCENCLGALKTSAAGTRGAAGGNGGYHASADEATILVNAAGAAWEQNPSYHKMPDSCIAFNANIHTLSASETITQKTACGSQKVAATGGQGLLTAVQCPFDNIPRPLATEAAVDGCLSVGDNLVMAAVCNTNDYDQALQYKLGDGVTEVALLFSDASFLEQAPPAGTITQSAVGSTTDLAVGSDVARALSLNVLSGAYSLSVSDSKGVSTSVTQAGDGSIGFTLPARNTEYTLKGLVKLEAGCVVSEVTFGNVTVNDVTFKQGAAGSITKAACSTTGWTAAGAAIDAPTGMVGNSNGLTLSDVHFCNPDESVEDCRVKIRDPNVDLSSPTSMLLIERHTAGEILEICDGVQTGAVGGVLTFGGNTAAVALVCPGPCTTSNVADLTLDWSSVFTVSLTDGQQEITAAQADTLYDGEIEADTKLSYLHSANSCQASGTVTGTVKPGCSILKADGTDDLPTHTKVTHMQKLLQDCGGTQDVEPSAFLIQSYVVELKNGDFLRFCNAKELSMEIEEMQGESEDTIIVSASTVAADEPIASQLKFAGYHYDGCLNGQQKLVVVIETDKTLDALSGTTGNGLFSVSNSAQDVRFESDCADPCATTIDDIVHTLEAIAAAPGADDLTISLDVKVSGTTCGETQTAARGEVGLELFGIAKDKGCASTRIASPEVMEDQICASLTPSGFGSGSLTVLDQTLSLKFGDEPAVEIDHDFFGEGASLGDGDVERLSPDGAALDIPLGSAYGTYTLTVYWEQGLSQGRRLLRSTHVFGAGDHESIASLVILPASAQIEDAVESLDAHETQGETTTAAPDAAEEDEGLSGGAIAGIIAGGVVVAGGLVYVALQASGSGVSLSVGRPKKREYSQVRRSERFSTMNF